MGRSRRSRRRGGPGGVGGEEEQQEQGGAGAGRSRSRRSREQQGAAGRSRLTQGPPADHHAVHQGDDHAELAHGAVETHAEQTGLQRVDEDQRDVLLQQP